MGAVPIIQIRFTTDLQRTAKALLLLLTTPLGDPVTAVDRRSTPPEGSTPGYE